MMGQQTAHQNALFYDFCLEERIPQNHLLRKINQFLDFDQIRLYLKPFYSHTGRPSVDPELMIRMLLVGYCYGIRSERRLCEEVNFNLAYRWFCGLGLEDGIPNHSTFSKNRLGRFRNADLLRMVFNTVVKKCIEQGLVGGEGFAIDASFVQANASVKRSIHAPVDWRPALKQTRAVKEYLDALDEVADLNRPQKRVSTTDPMSQWTGAKSRADYFYSTNYLIDADHTVIMDVEASPSTNSLEVSTTKTMIDRVEKNHGIVPDSLMGDAAYGTANNLNYVVNEKKIAPYIPVWEGVKPKNNIFAKFDFVWDEYKGEYRCPAQKVLSKNHRNYREPKTHITKANTIIYRSKSAECKQCSLKQYCCPKTPSRKITRSVYESARDVARQNCLSKEYETKYLAERKKVEMSFAHMKSHHNFNNLRLRGLKSANDEFLLVATTQNLKKLAMHSSIN